MIVIDTDGKEIDLLEQRNEEIKERLEQILKTFLDEKNAMLALKKPVNLGYRFTKQLLAVLSSYGQISAENVALLDYETIYDFWINYLDLTAYFNRFFEIVDNKQMLCCYMGINNRIYTQLEKSDNEDIRNLMVAINDYFIGSGFIASESGNAPSTAIKQRLGAKNVGHNVISASEELITAKLTQPFTPLEIQRQVEAITGEKVKLLGDKK